MMSRHATTQQQAARWAEGIDHVWAAWSHSLRTAEKLLATGHARDLLDGDELAERLRRAQYGSHAASELLAGVQPPPGAVDAHQMLVGTLATCRDTLGVVAVRAEAGELDDEACEIALEAVVATRRAFDGARATSARAAAQASGLLDTIGQGLGPARELDEIDTRAGERYPDPGASRGMLLLLWGMVATCGVLFTALVAQLLLDGRLG